MSGWVGEKYVLDKPNEYVEPEVGCYCADVSPEEKVPATGNMQTAEDTVTIPLEMQIWMYDQMADKALDDLVDLLMDPDVRGEIIEMARNRLAGGFPLYGCTMYNWDSVTRWRNLVEELADASVYDTSGVVERF